MNVLSCFDGISCGQVALERAGISVENYFASEIDPYAIKITQKNYPSTIQLGSIEDWQSWNLPHIDLIIGGSPCHGFSFAGKQLNFNDPRSRLFFVFRDILAHYKPQYFLLENVVMKKQHERVISRELGAIYPECVKQSDFFSSGELEPILIDSALVSAQSRKRLYWTNIPNITQPPDKHIYLKDIIEDGECNRDKSYCIDANYFKGGSTQGYNEAHRRQIVYLPEIKDKSNTVRSSGRNSKDRHEWDSIYTKKYIQTDGNGKGNRSQGDRIFLEDGKSGTLLTTNFSWPKILVNQPIVLGELSSHQNDKLLSMEGKSKTVTAEGGNNGGNTGGLYTQDGIEWRKLTVLECERLQTLPDGYTKGISNSRRYHAIGNGWTVDVIAHIFSFIK